MADRSLAEFEALRATIRSRGQIRIVVFLAGMVSWAVVLQAQLIWLPNPVTSSIPLLLLVTTFEIVRTLHVGIERIGRYLQVFHEETSGPDTPLDPPAWERTVMALGPNLPGAAGHPLFLPLFMLATLVNYLGVFLPGAVAVELGVMAIPHVAFLVWTAYCDRAMRRQRSAELVQFRELGSPGSLRQ